MKISSYSKVISIATISFTLILGVSALPSLANDNVSDDIREGLPGRRISGGVRMEPPADSCFSDFNQSLVSITPRSHMGVTALARPAFWFSIPDTVGSKAVEFRLNSEAGDLIYTAQVDISSDSGVSEFQLPESAPALSPGKNYQWSFSLSCNNGSQSPELGLEGWVKRVNMSTALTEQLAAASPQERVSLYQDAGLWHEQVSELLNLRRQDAESESLQRLWADLVESVGLTSHVSMHISEEMRTFEAITPDATTSSGEPARVTTIDG
ncbi:MAG: DUF928 domain-containing protein [Cyanobacteria bacterium J06621_3]